MPCHVIPKSIRFRLIEDQGFLDDYALRMSWTPFEAACIVRSMKPIAADPDRATVGVTMPYEICQETIDSFDGVNAQDERDLLNLTQSIAETWPDSVPKAAEVTEWARRRGLIRDVRFVTRVLGTVPDTEHREDIERLHQEIDDLKAQLDRANGSRGLHFGDWRLAILGFALEELALNVDEKSGLRKGGKRLNCTALANRLDELRDALGIPTARGFGFGNIEDTLRAATKAARKISEKRRVSPD